MKDFDIHIFICPPLAEYPQAPSDHSASELIDCPKCNEKMWLSIKKKNMIKKIKKNKTELFLGCYSCFVKFAQENGNDVDELFVIDLGINKH